MNTPNNQRRKTSQLKIQTAFLTLLETRELNKISVSAICELAKLNRSTFYANYLDIYDLIDSIKRTLEQNYLNFFELELREPVSDSLFLKLFQHIYDNQSLYQAYFKLGLETTIDLPEASQQNAIKIYGTELVEYHSEFFRAGITAIIKLWLNNNCRESPEEMFALVKAKH